VAGQLFHNDIFVEAFCPRDVAVQFDDVAAAGAAMEVIHVLRDESEGGGAFLPFDERDVRRVWIGFGDKFAPPRVPFPNETRFAAEGGWSGEVLRFEFCPKAGLRIAKCRHAAFSGDARTREEDDALCATEALKKFGRESHWRGITLIF
jgi:hypothetical protein